jgi:hypothetical protein
VIEAKDNHHTLGDGLQQALGYAETLDTPFAFSRNGDGFLAPCKVVRIDIDKDLQGWRSAKGSNPHSKSPDTGAIMPIRTALGKVAAGRLQNLRPLSAIAMSHRSGRGRRGRATVIH